VKVLSTPLPTELVLRRRRRPGRTIALGATVLAVLWVNIAQAQIYACTDAAGKRLTSDRPIPECAERGHREIDYNGVTRRVVPAPLTAEQERARVQQVNLERQAALTKRDERLRDKSLLMSYPNLEALTSSWNKMRAELQVEADQSIQRMIELHENLKASQADALAHKLPNSREAAQLRQKIQGIVKTIFYENSLLESKQLEITRGQERYLQDSKRLRNLLDLPG
jgi:Domain of unknown function (DUF4124)